MAEQGPVAIVTGAGSGIGRSTAEMLSRRGWRLVLAGRRDGPLRQAGAALAGPWLAATADVADPRSGPALVGRCLERFGRLDALVNNAAEAPLAPLDRTDPEMLRRTFEVNALGAGYLILAAWPVLLRQRGGRIVNVSTIGTTSPFPGFFAYASSKGAVEVMVKSCAIEGREHGVLAFGVAPGAVETPMLRAHFPPSVIPPSRCLRPADVARVIVECLAGERDADNGRTIILPSP